MRKRSHRDICLNPLKRVNSILTMTRHGILKGTLDESQSPQAGQFNSYTISQDQ